uniref:glutathione-specific gamma-glutamylcyclotransferase n=1 Tax=Strongyloides venezuelensis TaxID=75913 RepID=A0A0K0F1H9_STRVS
MYIFGYGSLLWYTDFEYDEVIPGEVQNFVRRFYQLSPDHRGTIKNPGRTVTLTPEEGGSCWGLAYHVPEQHVEKTIAYLDHRERAGYRRELVSFHPDNNSQPFEVLVYIAIPEDNPYLSPPTPIHEICDVIISSHGRSGSNLEYALRLADCVRRLAPHVKDDHLFDIESELIRRCESLYINDKVLFEIGYKLDYLQELTEQKNSNIDERGSRIKITI